MFEVDGAYENRIGKYLVLSINGPTMSVRYDDGSTAELNIDIQRRIWSNILAEKEMREKRATRRARRKSGAGANHYIKVINVAPGEELVFPGWEDRVVMAPSEDQAQRLNKGDRLIYFSPDAQTFFAVATITGEAFVADPKKYTYTIPETEATFFQIDVDAETGSLAKGVTVDSVELESRPDFSATPLDVETFYPISEDDFELLAEILTEISEEEADDETEEEDEDEEFEEDEE